MLTDDREILLLNLLKAIVFTLERGNEQQDKMVQALERLASAFQEDQDGNGHGPMPPLRS